MVVFLLVTQFLLDVTDCDEGHSVDNRSATYTNLSRAQGLKGSRRNATVLIAR